MNIRPQHSAVATGVTPDRLELWVPIAACMEISKVEDVLAKIRDIAEEGPAKRLCTEADACKTA